MFFHVKDLELHSVRFDESLPAGRIDFGDPGLRQITPLLAHGVADLLGSLMEIRVRGSIEGAMGCECDRCLEPMRIELKGAFELSYRPAATLAEGEEPVPEEESEVGFYEGDGLELAEVVQEQVLLWLPMQRLCRPDCKGICPHCGQDRNAAGCSCRPEMFDERWAALRSGPS